MSNRRIRIFDAPELYSEEPDQVDLFRLGLIEDFDDLSPEDQQRMIERERYWRDNPPSEEEEEILNGTEEE